MKKYKVLKNFHVVGRAESYKAGETIELTDERAAQFVGLIEEEKKSSGAKKEVK